MGERTLADICSSMVSKIAPQAFIAFADSRQGVEHVARHIARDDVLPYRGGYVPEDRRGIEARLHAGQLKGVISTSALELGIDVPQFEVGINLGVPQTRKALRQRIGRIGRSMPGAFAVIAPATTFAEFGGTFREYVESEVEPSKLYLENRCIQAQAARCLIDERSFDPNDPKLPDTIEWPAGFGEMFAATQPGAIRPRDLDQVLAIGSDCPHHAYPLRAMREAEFALRNVRNPSERLGTIDLEKALREAHPGATYYHMRRAYRVVEWRMTAYEHSIMLEPAKGLAITHALLSSKVSVSIASGELLDGRLLRGSSGMLAEILLKVADAVEGYRIGSTVFSYRDLRQKNWHMSRKIREFATTGVVIRIQEHWFAGASEHAIKTRQSVAEALAAVLAREHNIAPSEIRTAHTRIAIYERSGPRLVDDAIVLFDNVVGGLRLTSPIFTHFDELLERLDRAWNMAGEQALLDRGTVGRLREWHSGLGSAASEARALPEPKGGELVIYAPGSVVAVRVRGNPIERKLQGPAFVNVFGNDMLGYRYECPEGSGWVPSDQVEPIGHDWQHALWDPDTNKIREVAA